MHTLVHFGLRIAFLIVIAVLFNLFVVTRPNATQPLSRRQWVGTILLGLLIGIIFLSTTSLYAHSA